MQLIERKKRIEGTKIPAIIKNMQYFYINMEVYEDGMINCWELVDFDLFKKKQASNWVVTAIPDGSDMSIHGLGSYKIEEAIWNFNKNSYFDFVKKTVKSLNGPFKNIYKITNEEKERNKNRRITFSPRPKDFKVKSELFYQTEKGDGFNIFFKYKNENYLVNMVIYQDSEVRIYNLPEEITTDSKNIERMFKEGIFFTEITEPTWIVIHNFAKIRFSSGSYFVKAKEKLKELKELLIKLTGEDTNFNKCKQAYLEYLKYPGETTRIRLKELYESIPEHERMYLGDMDSKDSDYIRIIYHPNDKREV